MSSYISPFKHWIFALLVLLLIEGTVSLVFNPNIFDRTNFLQFSFARPETPQRLFMYHKFREFADSQPTVVQSGDSSGFYGIEPSVVMKYLPEGMSYLNMSCCGNLGFNGYYNTLKFMADRNRSIRYMVLHITAYTLPTSERWEGDGAALWQVPELKVFGDAVYREFMSGWRLFHLPSMAWRREATDFVYYAGGLFNDPNRPLLNNGAYLEFLRVFRETRGWMKETDKRVDVPPTECDLRAPTFFDFRTLSRKTYLEEILETHAELAREHDAKLIVVFQPVACTFGTGRGSAAAREALERFKAANPDVEIPFPLIETWPSELFSVPAHVKAEHTDLIGNRLGKALVEIIARDEDKTQVVRYTR